MNKIFTKIATACAGLAMAIGVGVAIGNNANVVPVDAADSTETITLEQATFSDMGSNNYGSGIEYTGTVTSSSSSTSIDVGGHYITISSGWQWKANDANVYNKTALPGRITNITVTQTGTARAFTAYAGTSQLFSSTETGTGKTPNGDSLGAKTAASMSWDISSTKNYTFFAIHKGGNAGKVTSVIVTFEKGGVVIPTTYTVTYDDNGATSGTAPTDETNYEKNATVTVLGNTGSLEKTDFTFDGWNTEKDGSGTTYNAGNTFSITDNITLYAKWKFNGVSYPKITDLNSAEKVAITTVKDGVDYFVSAGTTGSAPDAEVATIASNTLQGVSSSNLFTVERQDNTHFAFKNADNKYLVISGDNNNNVRINSSSAVYWTVTSTTNGFKMTCGNTGRWLGVYQTTDWRSYNSSTHANYGGSAEAINFYGIEKVVAPLDTIELRNAPTSDMEIGDKVNLDYYGMDTDAEDWTGNVTYTSSNTNVATIEDNVLTAVGAGKTNITVYANAGANGAKVESDPVEVTVLPDPTRIELPVGNYQVVIDANGKKSGDPIPDTSFEIKPKEGRTWYDNLTAVYSGVSVQYSNEYTIDANGSIEFTNHSDAYITTVVIAWFTNDNHTVSNLYVGNSTTPAAHTDNSNTYTYTLNTLEGIKIVNDIPVEGNVATSSFYSMTINLAVIDTTEEFHSLVVSKGASWDKTSYKNGNAPSNEGLVVTANYSNNGGTSITRSEDVTEQVSNWTFNPSTLKTGDTSFTVTATWDTHVSAEFTVTGINVTDVTGPIASGRYYIMNSEKTFGLSGEIATTSPDAIDLSKANTMNAFDVTLVSDNEYEISVTVESVKYYLVCNTTSTSGSNTSIKVTNTPSSGLVSRYWNLTAVTDENDNVVGYNVGEKTATATTRYLACYGKDDWRGYVNTNNGDPVINFVAEGSYADAIVEKLNADGLCNNGVTAPSTDTWADIASTTFIENELAILRGTNATPRAQDGSASTGTDAENAMARYDYIVGKYNVALGLTAYNDFLGRNPSAPAGRFVNGFGNSTDSEMITVIVVMSAIATICAGGFFFYRRRKEQQ